MNKLKNEIVYNYEAKESTGAAGGRNNSVDIQLKKNLEAMTKI
jgi:hypothetical protein